jgi:hypothetical protein
MKFDFLAIVMMIIAVAVGQIAGGYIESVAGSVLPVTGFLGALVGILAVGFAIYFVYTLATGGKLNLMMGVIFSFIVYVANIIAGYIASFTGFGGGLLSLVIVGVVASFIWGWVGGKGKSVKAPLKLK